MEEKGVTPEQRIGIYSHKGWEQIVAALAIQIVGCAYVAIDPNLPAIRQEFILNDSNISFIITSEELVDYHLQRFDNLAILVAFGNKNKSFFPMNKHNCQIGISPKVL